MNSTANYDFVLKKRGLGRPVRAKTVASSTLPRMKQKGLKIAKGIFWGPPFSTRWTPSLWSSEETSQPGASTFGTEAETGPFCGTLALHWMSCFFRTLGGNGSLFSYSYKLRKVGQTRTHHLPPGWDQTSEYLTPHVFVYISVQPSFCTFTF